jgi:hypothetical protein
MRYILGGAYSMHALDETKNRRQQIKQCDLHPWRARFTYVPCTENQLLGSAGEPSPAVEITTTASTVAATTQTAGRALLARLRRRRHRFTVSSSGSKDGGVGLQLRSTSMAAR